MERPLAVGRWLLAVLYKPPLTFLEKGGDFYPPFLTARRELFIQQPTANSQPTNQLTLPPPP
ncbi:hypothetical protein EBZ38_08320 [bacterium]|nr:hypothetical protein [bacterium]